MKRRGFLQLLGVAPVAAVAATNVPEATAIAAPASPVAPVSSWVPAASDSGLWVTCISYQSGELFIERASGTDAGYADDTYDEDYR